MKKKFLLSAATAVIMLAGCAANKASVVSVKDRPDWINGESAEYPRDKYVIGVGLADDRDSAQDRARAQIAQVFSSLIQVTSEMSAREKTDTLGDKSSTSYNSDVSENVKSTSEKMLEGVEIVQVYTDPQTKQNYALAILNRANAASAIRQKMAELDMQLTSFESDFNAAQDKFGKAKAAAKALALLKERTAINSDLRVLASAGSENELAAGMTADYQKALAALNIQVTIDGDRSTEVETGIIKALNSMGLTAKAGPADAGSDIVVSAKVDCGQIRKDDIGKWKWAQAGVTVSVSEARSGNVFLRFDVSDREASSDLDTAISRALSGAGVKTAQGIEAGIRNYFGKMQ
ncbi:MAG: LPP20 family lipoprotein [Elusimicrobiaceae bacterium]|jgi:hypothetical protein